MSGQVWGSSSTEDEGGWQPRVMVMFCDLVGSTELSERHELEGYGLLVRRYVAEVRRTIGNRFGGNVVNVEGDGLLALFGAPHARGDDAERAVRAALGLIDRVRELSVETERTVGEVLAVRIAVHRGQVYRAADDSVYGLAVNVAARLQNFAAPNSVIVSDEVERLVGHLFETEAGEPRLVKGLDHPIRAHRVVGERTDRAVRRTRPTARVGRVEEWARLSSLWSSVRGGGDPNPVVLVRGEAGVGKSYLVSEFADRARADGAAVVELLGSAFFEDSGLHPVRRLVERVIGVQRDTGGVERLRLLRDDLTGRGLPAETMLPLLAPILGLEPAAGYVAEPMDARRLNEDILDAACAYIEHCLGDGPSVLIVEDAHWADRSTLDLVERVSDRTRGCAVVLTARPGYEPFDGVEVIELKPFSEADSQRLIDALCVESPIDDAIRLDVVARGDGIPLYLEELVANVKQGVGQGVAIRRDEAGWRSSGPVPDLLYDLLAARLDSPTDVIPVATASAAIGRDVDGHLLRQILDLPEPELEAALETLCRQGVLEQREPGQAQYRFRHELLREVAYELQPPSRRRSVHGNLADALSSRGEGDGVVDWGVVASHFERATRTGEASDAYERAAAAARMRGAFAEARGYLSRSIDLLTSSTDHDLARDVREVRLRLQRGYLAVSEEGPGSPAAATDYERCLELTAEDPFGDEMFNTVIVLWTYHLIRGEIAQCRSISAFTYRSLGKREWYRNFNIAAFGILDCWEGDFRAARDLLELFHANRVPADEEQFVAEWFNPNEPVTVILTCVGLVRFVMGEIEGADSAFVEAIERARSMSFPQGPYSIAYELSVEAWMRMERRQFDRAQDRIERLIDIAAQHGFDVWTMVAVTQQTVLAGLQALDRGADAGELAIHAAVLFEMTETWKAVDARYFLPYYLMIAGVLFGGAGEMHRARSCLEDSLQLGHSTGMDFWRSEALRHLAPLEPDPQGRRKRLDEALELARRQRAALFELRIALDLAALDPVRVTEVERALGRLGRNVAYPEVVRAEAVLATGP
jgi:class 3 adenylate cyclase